MRVRKLFPRLTAHACVALLLLAPAQGFAQRRRQPRPRTRTAAPAPRPAATPAPRAGATQAPTPTPVPAATPHAPQQTRRAEPDHAFEELLAADAYTAYAELRRVGTLSHAEEIKSAVAALTLLGGEEARPVTDFYRFIADNAETLGESRIVMAFMPARAGLPQGVAAFELESPAAAVAFEPKLRRILGQQMKQVKQAIGAQPPKPVPQGRQGARRSPAAEPPPADFAMRRVGRWLISADATFTLKRLRGEEGEPSLADSARFQSVRSRFSNDSLFIYVDTNVAQQAWALQLQRMSEEQQPQPADLSGTEIAVIAPTISEAPAAVGPESPPPAPTQSPTPAGEPTPDPAATPEQPESEPSPEAGGPPAEGEGGVVGGVVAPDAPPPAPSAEEVAVRGLGSVLRNLWGGVPRIPGAVALGLSLDGGSLAVRLAVENTPDGTVALIPFLPNIISGPPVTADAASVAPADSELFVAGSLSWEHVYNSTLGAAAVSPMSVVASWGDEGEGEAKGERQPSADEIVASVEKLFGFKFREDVLPSLGNEVALSMPLDTGDFGLSSRGRRAGKKEEEEERDAEPGPVVFVSLNDTAKMREILPRLFMALGFTSPGVQPSAPEKRQGFEIRTLGASDGVSYAIVNNFLLVGELKAVRHCVDSFASRQTLAASNAYRDSTSWQARQKLVHLFVSDSIIRRSVDETKARSAGSTDPAVRALLMQLDAAEYAPASYEATNEGDVLVHQMRLPLSLVRTYATAVAVSVKDAPVLIGETTASYSLQRIASAQLSYRNEKKKERFGTLEELIAEELLEKEFLEQMEYKVELKVTSDKFEATATPKTYGKTGRRSFFIDESGTLRAADRKGQPATADDPVADSL